jgi:hypothetical protein
MNIRPIGYPETRVRSHHYTLRNSPEERSCHLLRGGSLEVSLATLHLKSTGSFEVFGYQSSRRHIPHNSYCYYYYYYYYYYY